MNSVPKTQRVVITLSWEMYQALKALAEKNHRPMSEEARLGIDAHLQKHGFDVSKDVDWGGARETRSDDEGQPLAVAAS
jgi:hypothetical protein